MAVMSVTYELDERVAHVRMDDGKANVLNDASMAGLEDALGRAKADRAGAMVIWGRPRVFSGGIDLSLVREPDAGARTATLRRIARTLLAVWNAPLPTIAAITGHAVAGGAVLGLACDWRIAADVESNIGLTETTIGLVMPTWATVIAQSALGTVVAEQAILGAAVLSPREAEEKGFVHEVVAGERFPTRVSEFATELTDLPTRVYGATKRRLHAAAYERAEALVDADMGPEFAPQV
jgi:enoyl-CoA hydratase/carnithine racemase